MKKVLIILLFSVSSLLTSCGEEKIEGTSVILDDYVLTLVGLDTNILDEHYAPTTSDHLPDGEYTVELNFDDSHGFRLYKYFTNNATGEVKRKKLANFNGIGTFNEDEYTIDIRKYDNQKLTNQIEPKSYYMDLHVNTDNGYRISVLDITTNVLGTDIRVNKGTSLDEYILNNLEYKKDEAIKFEDFLKLVNKRNTKRIKDLEYIRHKSVDSLYGSEEYREYDKGVLTKSDCDKLSRSFTRPLTITKDEALQDIDIIEKYFRTVSGWYKFYGKEIFKEANNKLKKYVKSQDGDISVLDFDIEIRETYGFYRDGHARIGDENSRPRDFYKIATDGYYFDDYYFLKDDKGYYLKDYTPRTYLESVNDNTNLDEYLHHTVTANGEIVYMISYYDLESSNKTCQIVLGGTKHELTTIQMSEGTYDGRSFFDEMESFTEINGYPVVALRSYHKIEGKPNFDRYMKIGKDLENENVVIHDTRSNAGGNSKILDTFMSNLSSNNLEKYWDNEIGNNRNDFGQKVDYPLSNIVKNKDLIITLGDALSGSCGDLALIRTMQTENAITAGEPTYGLVNSGNTVPINLPNSGIHLEASSFIGYKMGEDYLPDGKGISPDLWIRSNEALDKVIKMLEYYDIKPSPTSSKIVEVNGFGTNNFARVDLDELAKKREFRTSGLNDTFTKTLEIKTNANQFKLVNKYVNNRTGEFFYEDQTKYREIKEFSGVINQIRVQVTKIR